MNLTVNLGALVVTLSDDELGRGRAPSHALVVTFIAYVLLMGKP